VGGGEVPSEEAPFPRLLAEELPAPRSMSEPLSATLGLMTATRDELLANLEDVRRGIASACDRAGRDEGDVRLVAATKTVPPEAIGWARDAGVSDFGENYVKELRAKHDAIPEVRWHYIGTLQTNTAHHVAALADVVETVTGGHAAERLARRASASGRTIDALIEVDLTGERTGVTPERTEAAADRIASLEGLRLVGLMTIPPIGERAEDARPYHVRLRELRDRVRERHPEVLELSMGMSLDYQVAVEEGATMVRVGTALFGPRAPLT
jgi:PLP dependent protein